MRNGGGFVGIHAAADTEYAWPWYGQMLGGYFRNHPAGTPTATVQIEDGDEPSTEGLPTAWQRTDEWYNYQSFETPSAGGGGDDYSVRDSGVKVLATMDESTYNEDDGSEGTNDDHPISWCSDFDGGHVWYTGLGHTQESFGTGDGNIRSHILGGLQTVTGAEPADCGEPREVIPVPTDFETVTIDDDTESPMELAVANDGRVFYVERITGELNVYNPANGQVTTAARIPVVERAGERAHGHRARPGLRHQQPPVRHLHTAAEHEQREPHLAVHGRREQHDRPGVRAVHLPVDRAAAGVLPLGRLAGVRAQRRPLPIHRRQHQPVRVRRLHADRRAARPRVLGCAAHGGELQQPQRQADPYPPAAGRDRYPRRRHDVLDPGGQHVRPGHRQHAARDLRDGLPQPVPDHDRSAHGLGAARQLRTGRRLDEPEPRPAGQRRVRRDQGARLLRLALLRARQRPVQRLQLRQQHVRREVQLQRAGQRLAQQHGHRQPAGGQAGDHVARVHRDRPARARPRHRRRPDGRPALRVRPGPRQPGQVPGVLRQVVVHRRVEQRLDPHRHARRPGRCDRRVPDPVGGHVLPAARDGVRTRRRALRHRLG